MLWLTVILAFSAQLCHGNQPTTSCINSYPELIVNLQTHNTKQLLDAFYPPNLSTSHSVKIYYCFYNVSTTGRPDCALENAEYIFQWVDNSLMLIHDQQVLNALAFGALRLTSVDASIVINQFCDITNEFQLLLTLTTWLKSYARNNEGLEGIDRGYVITYDREANRFIYERYTDLRVTPLIMIIFASLGLMALCNANMYSNMIAKIFEKMFENLLHVESKIMSFKNVLFRPRNVEATNKADDVVTKANNDNDQDNEPQTQAKTSEADQPPLSPLSPPPLPPSSPSPSTTANELENNRLRDINEEYTAAYLMIFVIIVTIDIIHYAIGTDTTNYREWLAFFPIPLITPLFLIISITNAIITGLILCYKHKQFYTKRKFWWTVIPLPLITTLIFLIMYHGYWTILLTIAYPYKAASFAIFLIPLVLMGILYAKPLIAKINGTLGFTKSIKFRCRDIGLYICIVFNLVTVHLKKDWLMMLIKLFTFICKLLFLIVLYIISRLLLTATDAQYTPFNLIVVMLIIIATSCVFYILNVPKINKEDKKEQDKTLPNEHDNAAPQEHDYQEESTYENVEL
jgi:hypothetical protein